MKEQSKIKLDKEEKAPLGCRVKSENKPRLDSCLRNLLPEERVRSMCALRTSFGKKAVGRRGSKTGGGRKKKKAKRGGGEALGEA